MFRPDDWVNPYPKADKPLKVNSSKYQVGFEHVIYEHGADAAIKALVKWLFEPCDKHKYPFTKRVDLTIMKYTVGVNTIMYLHRKDCSQCMAKLKEG